MFYLFKIVNKLGKDLEETNNAVDAIDTLNFMLHK